MEGEGPELDSDVEEDSSPSPSPTRKAVGMSKDIAEVDEWRWAVAQAFFDYGGLATDHLNSFNYFVERGIHEMFNEAEPFDVDPLEEERSCTKRVRVSFGKVELNCKPQVAMDDRRIGPVRSSGVDGSKSSADGNGKGKGMGLNGSENVKANWFADTEDGPSGGANQDDPKGSPGGRTSNIKSSSRDANKGKGKELNHYDRGKASRYANPESGSSLRANDNAAGEGSRAQAGNGAANCGDDDESSDEDDLGKGGEGADPAKGKGKCSSDDDVVVLEPPTVSRAMNDSSSEEDMDEDEEADAPRQSGRREAMDVDHGNWNNDGIANGGPVPVNSTPPTTSAKNSQPADEPDGSGEEDDVKSMGSNGDSLKAGPFRKPKRLKPNLKLLPVEARLRGITYSSPVYVKVTIETSTPDATKQRNHAKSSSSSKKKTETREAKVLLGRIPVMVKSSLCHLGRLEAAEDEDIEGRGGNPPQKMKGDCCLDPGGYFIIKGSEKIMVAQEERNYQRLWVSCSQGVWTAACTPRRKGFSHYLYHRTLVKLALPKKTGVNQGGVWPLITVSVPGVEPLPIGVLFSALGVPSDRQILEMICYDLNDTELMQTVGPSLLASAQELQEALAEWNINTFDVARNKRDKGVALSLIASKFVRKAAGDKIEEAENLLNVRFLPHLGTDDRGKALYLGYMVRTVVLCFLGRHKGTDRDDFKNKRLEFAGEIISHQFRRLMCQVINTMKKRIQKHLAKGVELQSAEKYLDDKIVTRGLKVAFSSGNWRGHDVVKNSGIVFDLKRGNPISTLCQLRELRHFVPPTVRVGDEARHPLIVEEEICDGRTFSQWGRVCPVDTPDGESCGLVKNLALTGIVSRLSPEGPVLKVFKNSGIEDLASVNPSSLQEATKVFVNGRWIGILTPRDADRVVAKLRQLRRQRPEKGRDMTQVEVVTDHTNREVHISTDGGRVLRPLLIVREQALVLNEDNVLTFLRDFLGNEKGKKEQQKKIREGKTVQKDKAPFQWLLQHGVVELLGIEEEEKAMIAFYVEDVERARGVERAPKFTHAEVHPSLLLGLSASLIPFPDRNQSSRNLFQAHKHSKQAIGVYVTNISSRADTSGQHLFYPQVQLVKTSTYDCLQKPEMFSGQNAIVAIACYTGYNQEDSIIMNQSSLDRGMFRTTHYRTVRTEEKSDYETFGKPSEVDAAGAKVARAIDKLDDDGLPGVGWSLGVGDVIVGKISKTQTSTESNPRMTDPSQRLKAHEKGSVEQVMLLEDEDGMKIAKVKLRETRMPQVGDKFSSMHGQKGIVGMLYSQEDLPYTTEGIAPDIIINPHAFPSRQTLGQMFESALGKVVAKIGEKLFATPFNPSLTLEEMTDALHKAGYEGFGTETMYNGFTGKPMEVLTIGPTFYQRLTHMVEDKIKYRSRGHVHPLTRQPVADRKRHGGVKFGEMERDCLIAHGASSTLQERSFILSDFHTVHVCTLCEQICTWNSERVPTCRNCIKAKASAIVKVELPYACKLLVQELMSMGISVRLKTDRL